MITKTKKLKAEKLEFVNFKAGICEVCKDVKTTSRSVIFFYRSPPKEVFFMGFKCDTCFRKRRFITCEKEKQTIMRKELKNDNKN